MTEQVKPQPVKINISKLVPQKNGNFSILVNDEILGEISAFPKAAFLVYENGAESVYKGNEKAKTYGAGTHTITFKGKSFKAVVKDLEIPFLADIPENEKKNEKAREELLGRVIVTEA